MYGMRRYQTLAQVRYYAQWGNIGRRCFFWLILICLLSVCVFPSWGQTRLKPTQTTVQTFSPTLQKVIYDMHTVSGMDLDTYGRYLEIGSCLNNYQVCDGSSDLIGSELPEGTQIFEQKRFDMSYSDPAFVRLSRSGLDLEVRPHASIYVSDEALSAQLGAYVRIGGDLRPDDLKGSRWYFFAAADAQAHTYQGAGSGFGLIGNWQDKILVGDAQAGIGYRVGDADISLSYNRREVSDLDARVDFDKRFYNQDTAKLSFTWRK